MRVHLGNALETLYAGQFTLSIQLIKPNYLVISLTDAVPQLQNYPLWISKGLAAFSCCRLLIKTLLSVISEKGVKLMNAITYFLNKARYYASLIKCSVRQVFERLREMGWANCVEGTMNLGSQSLILCNMSRCYNSSPSLLQSPKGMQRYSHLVVFS